jgi:hypothetical protein
MLQCRRRLKVSSFSINIANLNKKNKFHSFSLSFFRCKKKIILNFARTLKNIIHCFIG